MVDILRAIIRENLPDYFREKIAYNVPFYYGRRGICIIWPATIPRGGIKNGVLLGFWQGNRIKDEDQYLLHGKNKKVYYRIFDHPEQIEEKIIVKLLSQAVAIDQAFP